MLESALGYVASAPLTSIALALAAYVLLGWVRNNMFCPEVYGRHSFKTGRLEKGSFRRRQLDKHRAEHGNFPRPFPDGWYKIADSKDVPVGKVLSEGCLGREFVVFRGEDGKVGVVDAFCSHLGTHLGFGGQVVGNNLQCPYHLWEFDADGKNQKIPYCKKDMSGSQRVNLKRYTTYESKTLESIFFWFSADDSLEPRWELHPGLKEVEKEVEQGRMYRVCETQWPDMLMHVFEPSQNSADYFHFQTVHQYLPMPYNLKLLAADHVLTTVYGRDDSEIPKDCLLIREKLGFLRLFGSRWLTLPQFIADSIVTWVFIQGPNNVVFKVDTLFGRFRAHFSLLPQEAFQQKATMVMYADSHLPYWLCRVLHWWIEETAGQDSMVWEHKQHVKPRNLVAGDGPFAQYGRWLEQFYSEKSMTWAEYQSGKTSLEW